ncbi:MAG: Gfo/Idh/MocA family oxidoreductase [Oscillospiraceae bacterium]|nr:Gfo/Idh/MocA family oxidoreductase [Oscillospiraceae bacterium]
MIKIAMISAWHVHAKGYARDLSQIPDCKITCVWDEVPDRGKQWAQEFGCAFIADYDELLKSPEVDAVLVNAPTNLHAELLLKAAEAGKHIFTEKVLTLTARDAYRVREAVNKSGVHFTISYPHKCSDGIQFAKEMIDSGRLGKVTYARVRNCHSGSIDDWLPDHFYNGEQCGGGAMIDLGAHPMYLLEYFLGKPVSVQSLFVNASDRPVEDNAVCLLEFADGVIGVSETGFVSRCDPYSVEISGTEGAVRILGGHVTYATAADTERKFVDAPVREYNVPKPLDYWTDSIKNDTENVLFNIDEAVSLTELMEAAYDAAAARN